MTKWPFHSEDEIAAVVDVLRSGKTNFWSGEHGQKFEEEFAAYCGARYALAVSNGTTALEVALHTLDLEKEDEVITSCRTFMASASSVVTAGGRPILADIDPATLNVTVETLAERLTPRTKAVVVVHAGGLPCDMEAICAWAEQNDLVVLEDSAHAHGARINGQHVGTFGDIGCFSFCYGKIMSTGGEGGVVITNDEMLWRKMGARRDHGRYQMTGSKDMTGFQWTVDDFGTNARLTEMQAAIARLQLQKLDGWNSQRDMIAKTYDYEFEGLPGVRLPHRGDGGRVWYLYNLQVPNRDEVMIELNKRGVAARIGGCPNIGREKVFGGMAHACPRADEVGEKTLSLPVYPTMTADDVANVVKHVREVCG